MGKVNSRSNASSIAVSFGQSESIQHNRMLISNDKTQVMNKWKNFYKDKRRTQHRGRRMGYIFDFFYDPRQILARSCAQRLLWLSHPEFFESVSKPADRFVPHVYSPLPQDAYPSASRNRRLVILNGYITITFILHVYVMHDTLYVIESFTEIPLAIEDRWVMELQRGFQIQLKAK